MVINKTTVTSAALAAGSQPESAAPTAPLSVSVVVPLFNERECAEPLIASLRKLERDFADRYDFEFVLVDDGSIDETVGAARSRRRDARELQDCEARRESRHRGGDPNGLARRSSRNRRVDGLRRLVRSGADGRADSAARAGRRPGHRVAVPRGRRRRERAPVAAAAIAAGLATLRRGLLAQAVVLHELLPRLSPIDDGADRTARTTDSSASPSCCARCSSAAASSSSTPRCFVRASRAHRRCACFRQAWDTCG